MRILRTFGDPRWQVLTIAALMVGAAGMLAACVDATPPKAPAPVRTVGVGGDPVAGKAAAYSRCLNCHSVSPSGQHGSGPNLFGLIGRAAGKAPGYYYSVPLRRAEFVWSEPLLLSWLMNPSRMVPGNAMNFQGIDDPARRDIIAYLATLKK